MANGGRPLPSFEDLRQRIAELELRLLRYEQQEDSLIPPQGDDTVCFYQPVQRSEQANSGSHLPSNQVSEDISMEIPSPIRPVNPQAQSIALRPRPPTRVIRSKDDMSEAERHCLVYDLIKARSRCGDIDKTASCDITLEDCDSVIDHALKSWKPSQASKSRRPMPRTPCTDHCGRVIYGTLRDNPGGSVLKSRQKGSEVYLYFNPFNVGGEARAFSYRDSRGVVVKAELVEPCIDLDHAKKVAMEDYNREELAKVRRFNDNLMVAKIHGRLLQFVSRGELNRSEPLIDLTLEKKLSGFFMVLIFET